MTFVLTIIEMPCSKQYVRDHRIEHGRRIEAWMDAQAQAGTLVGGEAFETEAMGPVTIRRDQAGTLSVSEAPFGGEQETLGGFLVIDVADRAQAVAVAQTWPTEETIEVRPIWTRS